VQQVRRRCDRRYGQAILVDARRAMAEASRWSAKRNEAPTILWLHIRRLRTSHLIDQLYNSMIEIGQYGKKAMKDIDAKPGCNSCRWSAWLFCHLDYSVQDFTHVLRGTEATAQMGGNNDVSFGAAVSCRIYEICC
jgi:hypothetical protein